MEYETYLRFVLALLLVLGLIAIFAWALRRFGFGGALRADNRRRIQVLETTPLGPRHRLVLVRRDHIEHLLLLGPQGDVVVERGIERATFEQEMTRPTPSRLAAARGLVRQEPPSLRPAAGSGAEPQENHQP
ncbi:flagellar biosynthetic protein FliO [Dongia rigui]|uniref:Flagellar protein n=1 Tax=Dongia rigui TaxID=940149 RepID=A0ABU5DT52_9PROT|nr:flagellar biosynthetic protein FliO [Dongia rigui]MDY0870522.1 flagellar biosynthetic protein FliO [Dongia rigui]